MLGETMSTEATTLLDMIKVINKKSYYLNNRLITVWNNNKELVGAINNDLPKESSYVIKARAEITRIKEIIIESLITIDIIWIS